MSDQEYLDDMDWDEGGDPFDEPSAGDRWIEDHLPIELKAWRAWDEDGDANFDEVLARVTLREAHKDPLLRCLLS